MRYVTQGRGGGRRSGGGGSRGSGGGRGRGGGNKPGSGPGGACVCPNCEYSQPHQVGVPCYTLTCPNCGTKLAKA